MREYIKTEKNGHVLVITFNRPDANNAFNTAMLRELGDAYAELEADAEVRVGIVCAEGKHFTLGLELGEEILDGDEADRAAATGDTAETSAR